MLNGGVWGAQVVMEYNFHWAGKQQMEMLMQPLPPTWGKFGHTMATWASSLLRCKVRPAPIHLQWVHQKCKKQ